MHLHSRVDVYAKAVALAGLGCLGLGGAIVDYRSGASQLPTVASILESAPAAWVSTRVEVPGFSGTAASDIMLTLPAPAPARLATEVRTHQVEPVIYAAEVSPAPPAAMIARIGLPALPVQPVELAPAPLLASPFAADELPLPTTMMVLTQGAADEDGFFSGVLQKTRSSVSTSFGKAGSSLVGAVRLVRGAVKKATRF